MSSTDKISFGHNIRYIQLTLKSSSVIPLEAGTNKTYSGSDFDITSSNLPTPSSGSLINLSREVYPWIININYNNSNSAYIEVEIYAGVHTISPSGTTNGFIISDKLKNLNKLNGSKIYLFNSFQDIMLYNMGSTASYNPNDLRLTFIRI